MGTVLKALAMGHRLLKLGHSLLRKLIKRHKMRLSGLICTALKVPNTVLWQGKPVQQVRVEPSRPHGKRKPLQTFMARRALERVLGENNSVPWRRNEPHSERMWHSRPDLVMDRRVLRPVNKGSGLGCWGSSLGLRAERDLVKPGIRLACKGNSLVC
jgi:hypothetical protein